MHNIIKINNFSLSFPNKTYFEDFSTEIAFGDRIAIIGRNGSGKSSLLKMIADKNSNLPLAYIPQFITGADSFSGGERFNISLSKAMGENPSMLLLNEPTNHLDTNNRESLMRMLSLYYGTLLVVSHDEEFLQSCIDILWHIENGKITIFRGKYNHYTDKLSTQHQSISHQLKILKYQGKYMNKKLMKEQQRASKSKASGRKKISNKKWIKSTADLKTMKAEKSQGKIFKNLGEKKQNLLEQLNEIHLPEIIIPKFHLPFQKIDNQIILSIINGTIGYSNIIIIAQNINVSLMSHEHIAIIGKNGSGKTTLLKAIIGDSTVFRTGDWHAPHLNSIGYLDQYYNNLNYEKSAIENIKVSKPLWTYAEIRKHLNDFLFRKNEEVNCIIQNLSEGEKARLSLAQIAAKVPKLLILDEITNNIDLETKNHIIEILQEYPAAMIVISHDKSFLNKIKIDRYYEM